MQGSALCSYNYSARVNVRALLSSPNVGLRYGPLINCYLNKFSEYTKYKVEKPSAGLSASMTGLSRIGGRVSGMLWVHLLAGRGLRPGGAGSPSSPPGAPLSHRDPPVAPRDLYCVLECDRVHKARTVVSENAKRGTIQFFIFFVGPEHSFLPLTHFESEKSALHILKSGSVTTQTPPKQTE